MKRRFIVGTNSTTVEQDREFKDKVLAEFPGLGWWHRLDELWLICDRYGRFDAQRLRDIAKDIFSGQKVLVLELNEKGDTWAGSAPTSVVKETFQWLHSSWKDDF